MSAASGTNGLELPLEGEVPHVEKVHDRLLPLMFVTAFLVLPACSRDAPQAAMLMRGADSTMAPSTPGTQHAAMYPANQATDPYATQSAPLNGGGGNAQQAFRAQQAGGAGEKVDFGVPATPQLRSTQQLHGPTPTSIPGGQVIGTQQLAQLLQGGQGRLLLLDVYGGPQHLPGAVQAGPAAQGGSFDDAVQQGFGQFLQQATGGDTSRMIVVYCGGVQCWSSYNAALRGLKLGYRNVAWYRGGIEAWQQAGLPMASSNPPRGQSVPQGPSPAQMPSSGRMQPPQPQPASDGPHW